MNVDRNNHINVFYKTKYADQISIDLQNLVKDKNLPDKIYVLFNGKRFYSSSNCLDLKTRKHYLNLKPKLIKQLEKTLDFAVGVKGSITDQGALISLAPLQMAKALPNAGIITLTKGDFAIMKQSIKSIQKSPPSPYTQKQMEEFFLQEVTTDEIGQDFESEQDLDKKIADEDYNYDYMMVDPNAQDLTHLDSEQDLTLLDESTDMDISIGSDLDIGNLSDTETDL